MSISAALLPEFDHEIAGTRSVLERVPEDRFGWKPHEKSFAMGPLAVHLATLPGLAVQALESDSFDFAPPGGPKFQMPVANTRRELLELLDSNVAKARAAIAGASDDDLSKQWTLLAGGKTIFSMPRAAVLRSFVLNHIIHHRAQLGVYLRLNGVPLPALYGPSADEGSM
ncbi:MAG: DinB family protein [Bryobacteraceae bacterium]